MAGEHAHIPIDDDILLRDDDSTYGDNDVASETTSLKSAISNYYYQHGRRYHAYHAGSYWGPNDAQSADQMDIGHHVFTLVLDGKLFLSPLGDHPQKILDIGTGTGIWAIDIADQFPSAQVIGTDLSPIQPREVPPNLQFEIDDCCSEWTYTQNSFDYIHVRSMYGSVSDWSAFYRQVYDHLKPGAWFEQFEMGVELKSDDGTVTEDSIFGQWGRVSLAAGDAFGKSLRTVDESKPGIIAAGLENVVERRYKLPVGGWSSDPMLKELGLYYRLYWEEGIELWSMYLLTNYLHWRKEEVEVYLARMRQMLRDKTVHAYVDATCVYGQKPMKYDSSFTDTSSYQSYETSTTSSDLAGEREKKLDELRDARSDRSNLEQHTKMSDVTNGIAGAGIVASNNTKPNTGSEMLPKLAYVEPNMNKIMEPDSIAKTSIGSPAGDSAYASPRANPASPLGDYGAVESHTQGLTIAGQEVDDAGTPRTNEKENSAEIPGSVQDYKMIGGNEQPTNINPQFTNENIQLTNPTQTESNKISLFGGSEDYKQSQVFETDGNYDRRGSNSKIMNSNTSNFLAGETHAIPFAAENTPVPGQISTDAIQPNMNNDKNPQSIPAPVQASASNSIPVLAQDLISLPDESKILDFAGNSENDKAIDNLQVIPSLSNQAIGETTQPTSDETLVQPLPSVNDAVTGTNDAAQPKPSQDPSYGTDLQKDLSRKDATFGGNHQGIDNIGSLPSQSFDTNNSAKNTPSTTMQGGHVVEDNTAKLGDQAEQGQGASVGTGNFEAPPRTD